LYSSAWIDLAAGPAEIAVPGSESRYFSLTLMDLFSNNFAHAGTRTNGARPARLRLVGPEAVAGPGEIRAPTRWVWALGRTLVRGPEDLAAARAFQQGLILSAPPTPPPATTPTAEAPLREQLAAALRLVEEAPPPRADRALLARWRRQGLDAALGDESLAGAMATGVARGRRRIEARREQAQPVQGWLYPEPHLGDFGDDHLYRASVAVWGLGALEPEEAAYMLAVGALPGGHFDGSKAHRLRFERGALPPARAFWSLSIYEARPDGSLLFFDNPIGRYAIGDRTPGLRFGSDGSLEIHIRREPPEPELRANWLPAPAGPFGLMLRAYAPEPSLLTGRYRLPPVTIADPSR
jgi:hypothetical protein